MAKKKTYAQKALEIKDKYSKRFKSDSDMDEVTKRSMTAELNNLFRKQEAMKEAQGIDSPSNTFSKGGDLHKVVKEAYANNNGKALSQSEIKAILKDDYDTWKDYVKTTSKDKGYNLEGTNESGKDFDSLLFGEKFANLPEDTTETPTTTQAEVSDTQADFVPDSSVEYGVNPDYTPYKTSPLADIASTAIGSLPLGNRFLADPQRFERVGTNLVDYDPERRRVSREIDETRVGALDAIRGGGGSRGQQLSNIANTSSRLATAEANALADSYSRELNTNSQIASQADARNAQIQAQEALQNYQDRRYVDEGNKNLDYRLAENIADLPVRLAQNKRNDMFLNSVANYGYDKDGNLVPKVVPLSDSQKERIGVRNIAETQQPIGTIPATTVTGRTGESASLSPSFNNLYNPAIDEVNSGVSPLQYTPNQVTDLQYSNGSKLKKKKKLKCGGKLKLKK